MADLETHRRYAKSLGLWRKDTLIEPDVDRRIKHVKATLAEKDAVELRRQAAERQENAYISETLSASQAAQKNTPTYPHGKSIAEIYGIPSSGKIAYDLTEPEWNSSLKQDLKTYLENRHIQVCILSINDAAKCALNIWQTMSENGETIGSETLKLLKEIHSKVDLGVGIVASAKLSKALGGLGITVKQYFDSKGAERVIISSLWNDTKMHYAVVNGLNIKKNRSYLVSNPTIKQLGVLAKDTVNGFKKGAVLSVIISAGINTNELVFNDDYHLVDWFGHVGSDLFKAMVVLAVSGYVVSLAVALGIAMPIVVSVCLWVGIDWSIEQFWIRFEIEKTLLDKLKNGLDSE